MDTDLIDSKGLAPVEPLLKKIDALTDREQFPALVGELQRLGVNVFFGYGQQQDYKDATKQIAFVIQAGLGMPEKDYYLRTGAKDETLRQQLCGARGEDAGAVGNLSRAGSEGRDEHHGVRDGAGEGFDGRG